MATGPRSLSPMRATAFRPKRSAASSPSFGAAGTAAGRVSVSTSPKASSRPTVVRSKLAGHPMVVRCCGSRCPPGPRASRSRTGGRGPSPTNLSARDRKRSPMSPNDYDPKEVAALQPESLDQAVAEAVDAFDSAGDLDALGTPHTAHLGPRSPVALARRELGALPPQARADAGRRVHAPLAR